MHRPRIALVTTEATAPGAALAEAERAFLDAHPAYAGTSILDELRATEYARLDETSNVYLDYTGGSLYAASQVEEHHRLLHERVLGNPHSFNPTSSAATLLVEETRAAVLRYFRADPAEYDTGDAFRERLRGYLDGWPSERPLAVEVRNASWIAPPLLDLLRARGVTLAFSAYYTMPGPEKLFSGPDPQTTDSLYLRFIGDHKTMDALVAEGWTTPAQLACWGGSNGGLLVGAALTQRPELFAAVVCSAPLLDMVRYQRFGLGVTWTEEYGDADDPVELGWLLGYSPYHRVVDGTAYPATLLGRSWTSRQTASARALT